MLLKPNRTIIDGIVRQVIPQADGFGCELAVEVTAARAGRGKQDFLGASAGDRITLFLAKPTDIIIDQPYRIAATVLAGPTGSRNVIESLTAR